MLDIILATLCAISLVINTAYFVYAVFFPESTVAAGFWWGFRIALRLKWPPVLGWILSIASIWAAHHFNLHWTAFMLWAATFLCVAAYVLYFIDRKNIDARMEETPFFMFR